MRTFLTYFIVVIFSLVTKAQDTIEFKTDLINVYAISYLANAPQFVTGGYAGKLFISGPGRDDARASIDISNSTIRRIAVHKTGRYIAVGTLSDYIEVIDLQSWKVIKKIQCDRGQQAFFEFHPSEEVLCIINGPAIQTIGLQLTSEASDLVRVKKDKSYYDTLCFSPDGSFIAASRKDNSVDFISYPSGQVFWPFSIPGKEIREMCFSPNGKQLAIAVDDKIVLVNCVTQKAETILVAYNSPVRCLRYHPNGKIIVSRTDEDQLRIWSLIEKKMIDSLKVENSVARVFDISYDGNSLAALCWNSKVVVFNLSGIVKEYMDKLSARALNSFNEGKWAAALASLNSIEANEGMTCDLLLLKGKVLTHIGDHDTVMRFYREAGQRYSNCQVIFLDQFFALIQLNEKQKAVEAGMNIIHVDPENWKVKCELVNLFIKDGKYREVVKLIPPIDFLKIDDNDICCKYIANSYQQCEDFWNASVLYSRYVKNHPEDREASVKMADCYYHLHQYEQSLQILDSIVAMNASNEQAIWFDVLYNFYQGKLIQAKSVIEKNENLLMKNEHSAQLSGLTNFVLMNYTSAASYFDREWQEDTNNTYASFLVFHSLALADNFHDGLPYLAMTLNTTTPMKITYPDTLKCSEKIQKYLGLLFRFQLGLRKALSSAGFNLSPIQKSELPSQYNERMKHTEAMVKRLFQTEILKFNKDLEAFLKQYEERISNLPVDDIQASIREAGRFILTIEGKDYSTTMPREDPGWIKSRDDFRVSAIRKLQPNLQAYEYDSLRVFIKKTKRSYSALPVQSSYDYANTGKTIESTEVFRGIERGPVKAKSERKPYKNYLFVIGINKYQDIGWSFLNNPENDARALVDLLLKRYQYFDIMTTYQRYNEQATYSEIIGVLKELARVVTEEDRLIIYYAGHGRVDSVAKTGFIIPYNAGYKSEMGYINYDYIKDYLDAIRAKHIVLFADACFSGSLFGLNESRGESLDEMSKSRYGITSARLETVQDSYENSDHSPFCHYLLECLNSNTKSDVTIKEVDNCVERKIREGKKYRIPVGAHIEGLGDNKGMFYFHLKPQFAK